MQTYPIKNQTAFVALIVLGVMIVGVGIHIQSNLDLSNLLVPYVGIGAVLIGVTEIGLKRFTNISGLSRLNSMQIVSLIIYAVVFVASIFLLFDRQIPIISDFLGGAIVAVGLFIIIETLR